MKQLTIRCLFAAGVLVLAAVRVRADEEEDLLGILRSDAAVPAKAEACKRLRTVGTARSVPVLGELLTKDERLGQAARYALEGMPGAEPVTALRAAAGRSTGNLRLGLVDSLGWRRDAASVPLLTAALDDPDRALAAAAASALGRVGDDAALAVLRAARSRVPAEVGRSVREALLQGAEQRVAAGDRAAAEAIYQSLYVPEEEENIRQAAYAGLIRTSGSGAAAQVMSGLQSDDPAARAAAFRGAGEVRDAGLTAALTALLGRSTSERQIPLLALLRARGDLAARAAVTEAARSPDPAVRTAAIQTLGALGDATSVPVLLVAATSTQAAEQLAAQEALEVLPRGDVTAALVAQVGVGGAVEREAFRALRARAEASSIPALLGLCRSDRPATRQLALQTLGRVAGPGDLASLVQLLVEGKDAEARSDVLAVFETLVERMGEGAVFDVEPLVRGLTTGTPEVRRALLPAGALFLDERLRAAFRSALTVSDAGLKREAVRALGAGGRDPGLLPDLLEAARQATEDDVRSLALAGVVRLATDESVKLEARNRAEALVAALAVARRVEDRDAVVAGLGLVPHRLALEAVGRAGTEEAVRGQAEQAALRIAQALGASEFEAVEGVLKRLEASAGSPTVRSNALGLLRRLDSGWLVVGPYRQDGKPAEALFDIGFDPERPGMPGVSWRRAPGSADPARAGEVDLGGVTGGDQCVLYVRTQVFVPSARDVAFAIGSDDGIKLWVNGELVHANNAVRGLTPGQDRARGRLREGWNALLAKITQSTAGCGMTLSITAADGSAIPGLRIDPSGAAAAGK